MHVYFTIDYFVFFYLSFTIGTESVLFLKCLSNSLSEEALGRFYVFPFIPVFGVFNIVNTFTTFDFDKPFFGKKFSHYSQLGCFGLFPEDESVLFFL